MLQPIYNYQHQNDHASVDKRKHADNTHQLLGLRVCTAQDPGLIPGQETKMPQSHAEVKKKQNTVTIWRLHFFQTNRDCISS